MRFYCVTSKGNVRTNRLLQTACEEREITYEEVDTHESKSWEVARKVHRGDVVYRPSMHDNALLLETMIRNRGAESFYGPTSKHLSLKNNFNGIFHLEQAGLPVPKTVAAPQRDRDYLHEAVAYLGGLPLIVKVEGGCSGRKVIKVDTWGGLLSTVDFLWFEKRTFIMRQFIAGRRTARVVVLGDKAVAGIDTKPMDGDFRTNTVGRAKTFSLFDARMRNLAVKAVKAMGWEFGGVDILIEGNDLYVAEVNLPCSFYSVQEIEGGVDVAGMMVDYLVKKAEAKRVGAVQTVSDDGRVRAWQPIAS